MLALAGLAAAVPAVRAGRLPAVAAITAGQAPQAGRGAVAYRLAARLRLPETVTIGLAAPFSRPARSAVTLTASRPVPGAPAVVDFNKSYNPPCVFSPYATCPLPPAQNRLPVRIEAGEKNYEH